MLELILLLAGGLLLVALFFFLALGQWGIGLELPPAQVAQLTDLVPLSGVSYSRAERLFDARDYRFLLSQARLREAARQLERGRRQAALLWLGLLREDVGKLQSFRRTLEACGVKTDPRTEWGLLSCVLCFHSLHRLLTLWVSLFGLYAAPRAHTALLDLVRRVATLLAGLLTHLSPGEFAEVKQSWVARELSTSLAE